MFKKWKRGRINLEMKNGNILQLNLASAQVFSVIEETNASYMLQK